MVSINDVRETVLAICNKNNYGYISPDDFNLYAKQAQLEVFDSYMDIYNKYLNMQKQHMSGDDVADLAARAKESVEAFITGATLNYVAPSAGLSNFEIPSNSYYIINVQYGTTTFIDVEKVKYTDVFRLINSNLTAPTEANPVYVQGEANIGVAPSSIISDISVFYVRYPLDPLWDYVTLTNGEPMYNAAGSQDFEVHKEDEPTLVNKILEKAGLSIREVEVYRAAAVNDNQQQQ